MTLVNKNRKSRDENAMAKYNEKELADTSKFLSFVLRHKPEAIGIVLDREGWADIDKLILCAQKAGKRLTRALLDTVVATSDKKRFSYSSDGRCIRAVQGIRLRRSLFPLPKKHRHSFSTTVRQAVSLTR